MVNEQAKTDTCARMAREAIAANSKSAGGRRANARMGIGPKETQVNQSVEHDRLFVKATFPTGETFRFSVTRSGERISVLPTKATVDAPSIMRRLPVLTNYRNGFDANQGARIARIAEACRGAQCLADLVK